MADRKTSLKVKKKTKPRNGQLALAKGAKRRRRPQAVNARKIMTLYLSGVPNAEIAKELDCHLGTVALIVKRCRDEVEGLDRNSLIGLLQSTYINAMDAHRTMSSEYMQQFVRAQVQRDKMLHAQRANVKSVNVQRADAKRARMDSTVHASKSTNKHASHACAVSDSAPHGAKKDATIMDSTDTHVHANSTRIDSIESKLRSIGREIAKNNSTFVDMIARMGVPSVAHNIDNLGTIPTATDENNSGNGTAIALVEGEIAPSVSVIDMHDEAERLLKSQLDYIRKQKKLVKDGVDVDGAEKR